MYNPKTQWVWVSHNVVWLHHRFYQKAKNAQELNTDPITIGHLTRNTQGVLRFIEVGEGVSEGPVMENAELMEDNNNPLIENEFEHQPIEEQETHVENLNVTEPGPAPSTPTVVMASGRVSQPPVWLIEEMGEAALTAAKRNYYFSLLELSEEREYGCVCAGIGSGIHNT